jgi:hypothetical protein
MLAEVDGGFALIPFELHTQQFRPTQAQRLTLELSGGCRDVLQSTATDPQPSA